MTEMCFVKMPTHGIQVQGSVDLSVEVATGDLPYPQTTKCAPADNAPVDQCDALQCLSKHPIITMP